MFLMVHIGDDIILKHHVCTVSTWHIDLIFELVLYIYLHSILHLKSSYLTSICVILLLLNFSVILIYIFFYRDTYDKEVKAKLTEKPKQRQNKQKKPDIHVYVPPTKLKGNQLWIAIPVLLVHVHVFS